MRFRAATFNIRNGDAEDGLNSWRYRRSATVEMILSLDAGIIGLQEVLKYQLDYILDSLPEYAYTGAGRIDGSVEGEFAPILYRRSEWAPLKSGWFMLSETPEVAGSMSWNTACERICTWATFPGITVFNTHLDHISGEARLHGVELILSRVEGPALVMGDFNAQPSDSPIQTMLNSGFQDAGLGANEPTFHNWARGPGERIDYLFSNSALLTGCHTHLNSPRGKMASDHFPVSAWVEL